MFRLFESLPRREPLFPNDGSDLRAYGHFRPDLVGALAVEITGRPRGVPGPLVADLCRIFDWMHAHIAYADDPSTYGRREYIATPAETRANGRGDCEDHGLLIGSLAAAVGARPRMVLAPGHAACQVALPGYDEARARRDIEAYYRPLWSEWRVEPFRFPDYQSRVTGGWSRVDGRYRRERSYSFVPAAFDLRLDRAPDGVPHLALDSCTSRMPGDVTGLMARGCMTSPGVWAPGTRVLAWSPEEGPEPMDHAW
jgi:hypothetical protein